MVSFARSSVLVPGADVYRYVSCAAGGVLLDDA